MDYQIVSEIKFYGFFFYFKIIGNPVIILKKYRELRYKDYERYREKIIGNLFPITKFPILSKFLILFAILHKKKTYGEYEGILLWEQILRVEDSLSFNGTPD